MSAVPSFERVTRCHYCNGSIFPGDRRPQFAHTVDHYRPKAISGAEPNVKVDACSRCNGLKGSSPPEVFERYFKLFGHAGLNNALAYRRYCYELMLCGLQDGSAEKQFVDRAMWMHGEPKTS